MKFKLGDFVRFVDERMEGYITRIIDDKTVGVTTDDFEIPVLVSKITHVHDHGLPDEEQEVSVKAAVPKVFSEHGISLAFITDPRINSVVSIHLLNATSYRLLAVLNSEKAGISKGEFAGTIEAGSAAKIFTASLAELNSWPRIVLQVLFFSTVAHPEKRPLIYTEKYTAKDFSGLKKPIAMLQQPGWQIELDPQEVAIDPEKLRESFFKTAEEKLDIPKPLPEIDLHIERLRDDHQFLNSYEMLTVQLNEFRKNLDAAIAHKLSSIIFIHGSGNGTLRHEIHKVVSKHPEVKTFMDARKEKFGYGATEVIFK